MTVVTINAENNITVFPNAQQPEVAAGTGVQSFASQKELAKLAADWPVTRLVETWNSFAGVVPLDHLKGSSRIMNQAILRTEALHT